MNKDKIYSVKYESSILESLLYIEDIYSFIRKSLEFINISYPNFESWITKIFIDTKQIENKERDIFIIIDEENKKISGLMVLKLSSLENKICTLVIFPEYRNKGLASLLINLALSKSKKELTLTVSENKFLMFKKLLDKFGFNIIKEDYIYNEAEKELFLSTYNKKAKYE